MKLSTIALRAMALSIAFCFATVIPARSQSRQVSLAGSTTPSAAPLGTTADGQFEFDQVTQGDDDSGNDAIGFGSVNRQMGHGRSGHGDRTDGKSQRDEHLGIELTADGLNFHDQRFANNGNQFSVEPPDQGLCAGNGFILESLNDVLRIFDRNGNPLIGVVDLNTFYGYPAAINRAVHPTTFGQFVTDPSCYFDQNTQRWFQLVLTLERVSPTTQALNGKNHLDLAVSQTANPLGAWNIYRISVQDDGTDGTPNHQCTGGACLGDFPHIGADNNGIYLTTNEFNFFARGFRGAQIYAISKQALAAGASSVSVFQFDTGDATFNSATGFPGFAVIPAISAGEPDNERGGTEFLLSSTAVFQATGVDTQVQLWSFTHTRNLNFGLAPNLSNASVPTEAYGIPRLARQPGVGTNGVGQQPGGGDIDWPQGQCLNDPTCAPFLLSGHQDPFLETISPLAGDDSRMKQVYFADDKLWSTLGTGVSFDGVTFGSDGVAFFVIKPDIEDSSLRGRVKNQGYVATLDADLTYPTFGVTHSGRAVISFTLTGLNNFPSLAYVNLDEKHGAGDIHVASAGVGVQDGFTGYKGQVGSPTRPRWGDYGATAVDGDSIFAAQEYIGQNCNLATYRTSSPFGTCSSTRGALGNWGTRIARFSTNKNED
jgi:hypothetical protein